MDKIYTGQSVPDPGGSPFLYARGRDQLTAGIALADAILDGSVTPEAGQALAEFHEAVLGPLLEREDSLCGDQEQVLRWGQALDAAARFEGVALAAEAGSGSAWAAQVSVPDVSWALMRVADLIARSRQSGPLPSAVGPEVLVDGLGGQCYVLTVRGDDGVPWHTPLNDAERASAQDAIKTVLAAFPAIRPTSTPIMDGHPGVCWPPGVGFAAQATALPMALWRLSEITGLSTDGLLSAGEFDGTRFRPLQEPQILARRVTAQAAKRDLLVPGVKGWQRYPADGSGSRDVDGPLTLDGVARVVWGDAWTQWKRDTHAAELTRLGWHFVDWNEVPANQPIADHRVRQVVQLERYCLDSASRRSFIVLGGTARSGRSSIVRQLARSLSGRKRPWLVQVISGSAGGLPDRYTALEVASHALATAELADGQADRRLLVFEDLQPISHGDASEILRYVAEQLQIITLGVLEYAHSSPVEWDVGNAFVTTSVVSREQRKRFVEDIAAVDAALDPAPAYRAIADGSQADLRTLTMLMSGDIDTAARRAERFAQLPDQERAALVRAAAISLVYGEVRDDDLSEISDVDRRLFGVGPGRLPSTARLASAEDCIALLDPLPGKDAPSASREPRWRVINSVLAEQLEPELSFMLRGGDRMAVQRLDGIRLFHQGLCRKLLEVAADEGSLQEWAAAAPLMNVTRIVSFIDLIPDHAAQELVDQMVSRICRGPQQWSPAELLPLIRACQQVDFLMSSAFLDEYVLWFAGAVDRAIEVGDGRPDERFALLAALERLNRDEGMSVIAERALDVLSGLTVRVEDYRLVQQVHKLQRRAVHRAPTDVALFPVDQENPVQFLLQHKPEAADGVGALLAAMNLRVTFGEDRDFERTFDAYKTVLNQALRSATASQLAQALQGIHSPIPQFCTWLIWKWSEFPERTRELMWRSAGATDAAALLNAVAKAGLSSAFKLLDDRPDDRLACVIAKRAADTKDAKGIGMLLSAAKSIEDVFGRGGNGFCTELAEAIGEDTVRVLIRDDPRTSVHYHVIKGVWDAQANYRSELLDTVLSVIVDSIRRGRKHWGPAIALQLALDPEMGTAVLAELKDRVSPEIMLSAMTSAITAHGRALYHRLGRALHPDVPARFLRQWELVPFAEGLATSSPSAALEACVEVARTLTDADIAGAGTLIIAATGGPAAWARKLRSGRQQEAFAQAIRDLTTLDRIAAGEVLDRLRNTPSHITIGNRPADVLLARLRHAMLDGPTVAPTVLRAIHDVRPQLATDLLSDIVSDQHATFVFRGEIQQLQDPVAQSNAVRNLIRVGITRGSAQSAWLEPIFGVLIQVLRYFTGPKSVTALLRMLATWDPSWGTSGSQAVHLTRIRKRLRLGTLTDIADAVELTRTLAALNNEAGAQQILEELLNLDVSWIGERLDLNLLCALVEVSQELVPDMMPQFARALAAAIPAFVERSVILDERTHWLTVGRACRVLRQTPVSAFPAGEARVPPNVVYAPAVAWAATGLDQPDWGDDALGRSAVRLRARPPASDVTDRACMLSATGQGWATDLRAGHTCWDIGTAPFWLLRILYAEAAADPYLDRTLTESEPTIVQRVNSDSARPDWDASQLRLILGARALARTGFKPDDRSRQ